MKTKKHLQDLQAYQLRDEVHENRIEPNLLIPSRPLQKQTSYQLSFGQLNGQHSYSYQLCINFQKLQAFQKKSKVAQMAVFMN
ncbi:hypothetical protein LJC43_06315 [Parabacteroides sp. OttesenSCG-928-G21]|jgi:hypothetical protein|nr:hypothetical protein [Parabacteroides sp. OttesenSCG-928-G21]